MPPPLLVDPSTLNFDALLATAEQLREVNPQRFEMQQLDGILCVIPDRKIIVGYKDVRQDEFWVRGHMPGYPILPGVLICEAVAQLCSYYIATQNLAAGDFVAFGGMEKIRFRGAVKPGDRLILAAEAFAIRPGRRAEFHTQAIVNSTLVFHGDVIGVPFSKSTEKT